MSLTTSSPTGADPVRPHPNGRAARTGTRLDPVRRPRLRRGPLLRGAAVATLLCLAALLLYSPPGGAVTCPAAPVTASTPPGRLPVPAGLLGLPIGLSDPAALAVLHAGDRVDLYGDRTQPVARAALVLETSGGEPVPTLYLAISEADAARVLGLNAETRFRVVVRPP